MIGHKLLNATIFGISIVNKNTVHNYFTTVNYVARSDNIGLQAKSFGKSSIFNPTIISFEKISSYWLDQFFLCFSLVTINRQTWYDSGILR